MSAETLAALRAGRLAGARELRLAGLGLSELPDELFGLADTLELLDIGGNALTNLPAGFARLTKLKVLFASGNPIERLPPVLGDCPALAQLGFRGCGLRVVPAESLPARLRWLTLTDNALERLPATLGERPALQKLMLAGNRLDTLPPSLRDAPALELIRLAANRFEALPPWLADMPRLAWLAWAGNSLDATRDMPAANVYPWPGLLIRKLLGQGASGLVYEADWHGHEAWEGLAVKLFKGVMTSDGLPASEMASCLAAGWHPNLTGGLGRVTDHPEGLEGLVMPLLPAHWRVLAGPPSLATCSRDVYDPALRLPAQVALSLAAGMARAGTHLHARGLLHGDLYAHNILWDGGAGEAVLSDFGAASFMPTAAAPALEKLDVLALGILMDELLALCDDEPALLRQLREACVSPEPASRPRMAEVAEALA